jgi:hypothetical protein
LTRTCYISGIDDTGHHVLSQRETGVTLNQIRMNRQLEEALTHGSDALHLAAVFGISERAAIRYANAARAFLETPLEQ